MSITSTDLKYINEALIGTNPHIRQALSRLRGTKMDGDYSLSGVISCDRNKLLWHVAAGRGHTHQRTDYRLAHPDHEYYLGDACWGGATWRSDELTQPNIDN